jgi:hypothetical protein
VSKIHKFGPAGTYGGVFASISFPEGLAFDSDGRLYVITDETIEKFSPTGIDLGSFASTGSGTQPVTLAFATTSGTVGDYNGDGNVAAADYVVWRKGAGTTYSQNDYDTWRSHFGQHAGSGSGASANFTVPEPATLVLLMFAAAGWCLRRGRAA